jgi:hypothetical protein
MSRVTIEFGATAFEQDGASVGVILNALARLRVRSTYSGPRPPIL